MMKLIHSISAAIVLLVASVGTTIAGDGKTAQGEPFVSGGVGIEERDALLRTRGSYALFVKTAAKGGAYLAEAEVKITDKAGQPVLTTKLDGPWLLVNLKLGEYKVTTNYGGRSIEKWTNIHRGDNHEMVFYFDESVEMLKKGEKP
jgi:hypothetical protein